MKTAIIVNPNSGKLLKKGVWDGLKSDLAGVLDQPEFLMTTASGDAAELARRALLDGATTIVAVGGDGTLGETINGFFEDGKPINPDASFAFVMCGTGNDFQKTLGRPPGFRAAIEALKKPRQKIIDVGRLSYISHDGRPARRYFLNLASFGMSGEVDRRVNRLSSRGLLGGKASFLLASAAALGSYRNKPVRLVDAAGKITETKIRLVIVANGRFAGGGMQFAPQAALDDGLFDIVVMDNISAARAITNMPKIYSGNHIGQ